MGFAPHPYGGICSLANCKPQIRRVAKLGDFIIGTGSAQDKLAGRVVYWMHIDQIITFDEYWNDARFTRRRPTLNGSRMQHYGDNIYHTGDDGVVRQLDSFHSEPNGVTSVANLERDTGTTNRVLLGRSFAYFGREAPQIPPDLSTFVKKGPGHRCHFSNEAITEMIGWLTGMESRGVQGEPIGWTSARTKTK